MAEIKFLSADAPYSTNITTINSNMLYIEGVASGSKLSQSELTDIYSLLGVARAYQINSGIGDTSTSYNSWGWVADQTGYAIWKYTIGDYAYDSNNRMYLNGAILDAAGQASSESLTSFDTVYMSGAGGFTDVTSEAASASGTPFSLVASGGDHLYIGNSGSFMGAEFNFNTFGNNYSLLWETYSGGAWRTLDLDTENTDGWANNGVVTFDSETVMETTAVNSETIYWMRVSTLDTPSNVAKVYYIAPKNNVISLLKLNSNDINNRDWRWCSSGQAIYTTTPNTGYDYGEGHTWIASGSSGIYRETYFSDFNRYSMDYYKSSLTGRLFVLSGDTHISGNLGVAKAGINAFDNAAGNVLHISGGAAIIDDQNASFDIGLGMRDSNSAWKIGINVADSMGSGNLGVMDLTAAEHRMIFYSGGDIKIQHNAGGSNGWKLSGGGILQPLTNGTHDIGSADKQVQNLYIVNSPIVSSDKRNKKNIANSNLGLDFINSLVPVKYKWKDTVIPAKTKIRAGITEIIEPEKRITHNRFHYGLIAQDVKDTLSGLDFAGFVENNDSMGLRYSEFISPIIKSIQEIDTRLKKAKI